MQRGDAWVLAPAGNATTTGSTRCNPRLFEHVGPKNVTYFDRCTERSRTTVPATYHELSAALPLASGAALAIGPEQAGKKKCLPLGTLMRPARKEGEA